MTTLTPSLTSSLIAILPELVILVTACTVLIADLYTRDDQKQSNHRLTIVGLLAALFAVGLVGGPVPTEAFSESFIRDPMSDLLKGAILIVSLLTFIYAKDYMRDREMWVGEYHVLLLFAVLGMLIMVSANGFLTLYLGLELLSLCLYALVAFDRDSKQGAEAAMKYFVLGALGSGMLLYGISMLYGAAGGFAFADVAAAVANAGANDKILVFGLVFALIGIAFKFGAVPFHMWLPDVYQGAPTPIVLFLSSAPKIAAFAMAARILIEALGGLAIGLGRDPDHPLGALVGARQRGRHRADQHQAHAGLFDHLACGLYLPRAACRQRAGLCLSDVLFGGLRADVGWRFRRAADDVEQGSGCAGTG